MRSLTLHDEMGLERTMQSVLNLEDVVPAEELTAHIEELEEPSPKRPRLDLFGANEDPVSSCRRVVVMTGNDIYGRSICPR